MWLWWKEVRLGKFGEKWSEYMIKHPFPDWDVQLVHTYDDKWDYYVADQCILCLGSKGHFLVRYAVCDAINQAIFCAIMYKSVDQMTTATCHRKVLSTKSNGYNGSMIWKFRW